jgi:WD40 repeat protein
MKRTRVLRNAVRRVNGNVLAPLKERLKKYTAAEWLTSYLFGDDIFISYSRDGGVAYAEVLARRLSKEFGYSCRLDLRETLPGRRIPKKLLRGIQRCRMLVVIATERATKSPHVSKEIKLYKRTHLGNMSIIPIDFGSVLNATWFPRIEGLPPGPRESKQALDATNPSDHVLERIQESFNFTRRNRRLFLSSAASLILLMTFLFFSLLAGGRAAAKTLEAQKAIQAANNAKGEAELQRQVANSARQEAEQQKEATRLAAADAKRQTEIAANARLATEIAEKATQAAQKLEEKARKEANHQQAIATERLQLNKQLFYASDVNLAQRAYEKGKMGRAHELLDHSLPATGTQEQNDLRDFAWYYLWRLSHRELITFKYEDFLNSVAFSPDGNTLAALGEYGKVVLWDTGMRKELATLKHLAAPSSMVFSPDSRTLATGSTEWQVKLWDARTGRELFTLMGEVDPHKRKVVTPEDQMLDLHLNPRNITFSPDGRSLAARSSNNVVKLWDVSTGNELGKFEHADTIRSIAFSRDSKILATGSADKTVKLWDVHTGREVAKLEHAARVDSVAFSSDGKTLATGSADWVSNLWNARTGRMLVTLNKKAPSLSERIRDDSYANLVIFSPDGKTLAALSEPWKVKLWDVVTGKQLVTLEDEKFLISSVVFSPDSTRLAAYGPNKAGYIKLCDARGQTIAVLEHGDSIDSLAFSPDSNVLGVGENGTITLWDTRSGKTLASLNGHASMVSTLAFSPDGATLATGSMDKTVKLWNVPTLSGEPPNKLAKFKQPFGYTSFFEVTFSPDGKALIVHERDVEPTRLWRVSTGEEITKLTHSNIESVAFSPNGKLIAAGVGLGAGNSGPLRLFDTQTGQELDKLSDGVYDVSTISALAFSPDASILASGVDSIVKFWDMRTRKVRTRVEAGVGYIRAIAFSPSGKIVAVGGQDHITKLYDARMTKELVTLKTGSAVTSIIFSPDETTLATISLNEVMLWDAKTGKNLATVNEYAKSVAFSRDSKTLAIGSETLKLWDVRSGSELVTFEDIGTVHGIAFLPDGKTLVTINYDGTIKSFFAATDEAVKSQKNH